MHHGSLEQASVEGCGPSHVETPLKDGRRVYGVSADGYPDILMHAIRQTSPISRFIMEAFYSIPTKKIATYAEFLSELHTGARLRMAFNINPDASKRLVSYIKDEEELSDLLRVARVDASNVSGLVGTKVLSYECGDLVLGFSLDLSVDEIYRRKFGDD